MRKDFGSKTWLYPMPVLIVAAYDSEGKPNAMTAAWGGIYTDDKVGICISEGHKTTRNILASKAFSVSMATAKEITACDYIGITSGNKVPDKLERAGFHTVPSKHVNAPVIEELPMTMECEFVSYDEESNFLVGRIINISAEESILTDERIDIDKLQPISYDPVSHSYRTIGEKAGNAFSDGKQLK